MVKPDVDVRLKVDKVWTTVITEAEGINKILDASLSVLVPSRRFSWKFRAKLWDGRYHFYDVQRQRFFTGFLDAVVKVLDTHGYVTQVENKDAIYPEPILLTGSVTLNSTKEFPFDQERFDTVQLPILKSMLEVGRCCGRLATGGGKTELAAALAKVLKDDHMLILVPRIELLKQTIIRLQARLGEEIGEISSDRVDIQRVTVGMVMTTWNRRQELRDYLKRQVGIVINDEAHRSGSSIWAKLSMVIEAKRRFGISGTPLKGDDVRDNTLLGLTGQIIQGATVSDLAKAGYAVLPCIRFIDTLDIITFTGKDMTYHQVYDEVFNNHDLWELVLKIVHWHGRGGLIIFTERMDVCVQLGDFLKRRAADVGWDENAVEVSHGQSGLEHRLDALNKFKHGKIKVLVTTTILDEGVDVPAISGAIFMTGGKSIVRLMQRIGRGVRIEEGKNTVYIYDLVINTRYFKSHTIKRLDMYQKEKFDMGVWKWNDNKKEFVQT